MGVPGPAETTVAGRILDVLWAAGARTTFGLPGVHNLAFWAAVGPDRPRIMGVRHEQAAGYAADGLARATGGLGVALTTTGPGAANAVAAFGEAGSAGSPVLVVASDVPQSARRPGLVRGLLHESRDQTALFAPLAKAVFSPTTAQEAVTAAVRAVVAAMSAPRGPVYLGVPSDVLSALAPAAPDLLVPDPPSVPDADIDALLTLLDSAERPLMWAGGGVVAAGATGLMGDLATLLGAPVVTSYAGRGVLPPHHPMLVGFPPHEPEITALVGDSDLVVAVGSDLDGMNTRNWAMPVNRLVEVNVARHVDGRYPAELAVVGDAHDVLDRLMTRFRAEGRSARKPWADLGSVRRSLSARLAADPRCTDALGLVRAIDAALPHDAVIVCDMAVAGYWTGGYARVSGPRGLAYPVGWGTLGFGLPAAIGPAAAGLRTLAVVGDGGLAFAVGELATLVQERLPVTLLVADDAGYGMLRFDQQRAGHAIAGVDLLGPDLALLARAYGLPCTVVEGTGHRLRLALEAALAVDGPSMVVMRATLFPPRTTSPRWHET